MKTKITLMLAVLAGATLGAVTVQGLNAQGKPLAYYVAEVEVTDPAVYQTYLDKNSPLIDSMGGRFLTRGAKMVAFDRNGAKAFRDRRVRQHGEGAGLS